MKHMILLLVCSVVTGCKITPRNVYNEADYILARSDTSEGIMHRQIYIYKYDTSRKMQINYWDDGKILGKGFSHRQKLDGRVKVYDFSGALMQVDSFFEGKKISSVKNYAPDSSIMLFRKGKLEPFKSIDSLNPDFAVDNTMPSCLKFVYEYET
ncbi:MAG: hypothetical protein ABIN36_03215 [Ferruginibacter sp.]